MPDFHLAGKSSFKSSCTIKNIYTLYMETCPNTENSIVLSHSQVQGQELNSYSLLGHTPLISIFLKYNLLFKGTELIYLNVKEKIAQGTTSDIVR